MRRSVGMMMTECYDLLFTPFFCIASALESCICMGHWAVRYIALQSCGSMYMVMVMTALVAINLVRSHRCMKHL